MTDSLAQIAVRLDTVANVAGSWLLAPIGVLPGVVVPDDRFGGNGAVDVARLQVHLQPAGDSTGPDDIQAHLLALRLFSDSTIVILRARDESLLGAVRLLVLAIVPMLVMVVPISLLLAQLSLWYQARPLRVGEETVVTLRLDGAEASWPDVRLEPAPPIEVAVGPVRVLAKREVCWSIRARESGYHRMLFRVDDVACEKELAVGEGFMRVSRQRPGWYGMDIVEHPWEKPFASDGCVRSIEIDYPERSSWVSGRNSWVIYWFLVSTVAAWLLAVGCTSTFEMRK